MNTLALVLYGKDSSFLNWEPPKELEGSLQQVRVKTGRKDGVFPCLVDKAGSLGRSPAPLAGLMLILQIPSRPTLSLLDASSLDSG